MACMFKVLPNKQLTKAYMEHTTSDSKMDFVKLCRLCAKKYECAKDMALNDDMNTLIQQLLQISITTDDFLPTKVCLYCEEKIVNFQMFVLECTNSQDMLRDMYIANGLNDVKEEPCGLGDDVKPQINEHVLYQVENSNFSDYEGSQYEDETFLDEITLSALKQIKTKQKREEIKTNESEKVKEEIGSSCFVQLSCLACSTLFENWTELNAHCLEKHDKKAVINCKCGFKITNGSSLNLHTESRKGSSKEKKTKGRTKKNKVLHEYLKNFDCGACGASFQSYSWLHKHAARTHGAAPEVQCGCGARLRSRTAVYRHVHDHHDPDTYRCEHCLKTVKSIAVLEKHRRRHAAPELRAFQCSTCHKQFKSKDLLRSHMRSHIPVEERKAYECDICSLKFTTKSSAASHKKIVHFGIKTFVCDQCGYACGTSGELRQHRAIHSEDKPHQCATCAKRFKTYSNLKTHMDTHADTSYTCFVCARVLNSRRTLKKHLLVHQSDCRHVCSYCSRAFKRRQTLKVHMAMHTGDKTHACKYCSQRFMYASTLRSHRLRAHPDKPAAAAAAAACAPLAGFSYGDAGPEPQESCKIVNGSMVPMSKIEIDENNLIESR